MNSSSINKSKNQTNSTKSSDAKQFSFSSVIPFGLLFVSFIIAYFPVWEKLLKSWGSSDEYSYGFLIVPICIYILWQKKDILAQTDVKPSKWGLLIVVLSLILYLIAHFAEILTVAAFSMIPLLAGTVIWLFGYFIFKECSFALFFLIFLLPVPSQIYSSLTIPLQLFVSKISTSIASFGGIPIYREGNVIHLPDRTLQVVQACSGLRSLISLLTLSAVFGYFTLKSQILRGVLFLSAIPVAIIVNIIRVVLMVIAFYYFAYDLTIGFVHTIFGMVVFALAIALIVLVGRVISIWEKSAIQK